MAQYKDVIVNAGAGGFGGPLVLVSILKNASIQST